MANFAYDIAKHNFLVGAFNLGSDDLRVLLVMTNTTADTEKAKTTFAGFTTLDEYDGANYASPGLALAGKTIVDEGGNNRSYLDATDLVFSNLGAGTRQCQAAVLYKFVTALSSSIPIAFIDQNGFPFTGNGSSITLQWNAAGILQMN